MQRIRAREVRYSEHSQKFAEQRGLTRGRHTANFLKNSLLSFRHPFVLFSTVATSNQHAASLPSPDLCGRRCSHCSAFFDKQTENFTILFANGDEIENSQLGWPSGLVRSKLTFLPNNEAWHWMFTYCTHSPNLDPTSPHCRLGCGKNNGKTSLPYH